MTGVEVAAAMVFAWAVRKAQRVGGKADGIVDGTIDELGDRAHNAVMAKLRGEPAAELAEVEAGQVLPVLAPEVREGLELAITEALRADPSVQELLEQLANAVREARGETSLVTQMSVTRSTFSNDTTHTANTFFGKAVVNSGSDAEVHIQM
ncbi:hypothetical protein OG780_36755 [Streptomyces sp. NBC_00386]|uniref:hypothetical protein n=1 Tax=Streptomyces sp. NBC_00386 TaxID=2975734 RepID=UPI002E1CC17D